ncbi:hypothetical protein MCAMS1_02801 [biofilm metagenome]
MGWLTVAAYFTSAGLSFLVFWKSANLFPIATVNKQQSFWLILTFSLLFLGVNKQLDIQSYLTAIGKYFAMRGGWYQHRQVVQWLFIKFILLSSVCLLAFLLWYLRETLLINAIAIVGICLLIAFIAIRASSFHHVDLLIHSTIFNVRINWIIELSGIMMIALSAVLTLIMPVKH